MTRKQSPKDPWEDWMGKLKYPVHPDELLDRGLAKLIKAMNISGKIYTMGSCLHDIMIIFGIEDEQWFLNIILPRLLRLNDKKYGISVEKQYDHWSPIIDTHKLCWRQIDKYSNQYCWVIKDKWRNPKRFVKDLQTVFPNP